MSIVTCGFSSGATPLLQMKLDLSTDWPADCSVLSRLQKGASCEADVANVFARVLRAGDVAVDVGANIGYLTVLAALIVGPTGHVVAFEPDPENIARLRVNLALNDCTNVTVISKAVTNKVGEVEFFINSDNSGGNALWDPSEFPGNLKSLAARRRFTVPGTTLDAEWQHLQLPIPKAIKIDTEGAEQRVLEGMHDLLVRQPLFVVAELHEFGLAKMGCSERSLRGFVEGLGYSTFGLTLAGTLPRFVPAATRIQAPSIIPNVLFSKPEWVGEYWPTMVLDPLVPG
jgi:FkbM family methyltransferase